MEKPGILCRKLQLFQSSLLETTGHFRNGRDDMGLASFLISMDDLEDTLNTCVYLEEFRLIEEILGLLRMLREAIKNEDIVCVTDIFEYTACPLTEKWLEGNKET